jgi:Holliday junction resolvasome RuvABC endonuclease subunit
LRILALDQASRTGYAVFDDNKLIECGVIDHSNIKDPIKRISQIKKSINKLIRKTKAEVVILEDAQLQFNVHTFKILCKLLGVLETHLFDKQIAFKTVRPGEWRRACKIKGKKREEQKVNTIKWVKRTFGVDATSDECDAIAIGWYLVQKMRKTKGGKNNKHTVISKN